MDIVRFKGGLGNQMFQYALAESLRSKGRKVGCSLGYYRRNKDMMPFVLDEVFPNVCLNEVSDETFEEIDNRWKKIKADPVEKIRFEKDLPNRFFYVEEDAYTYFPEIYETQNCSLVGYWQTEKYFIDIRERIREVFQFSVGESKLQSLAESLGENFVSVHVRRGDYLQYSWAQVCTPDYYQRSILKMKELIPGARFIFFSDDTDWVRENFHEEDMLVCSSELFGQYKDWYDMYLMTRCRGNIVANSSFSWWGAWLNVNENTVVISPEKWSNESDARDIWCKNWIKIRA